MTREKAKELAPIIQAFGDGVNVEYNEGNGWHDASDPRWYSDVDYRIKPEPKTRPMTRGEVLYMVTTTPAMVSTFDGLPFVPAQGLDYSCSIERYRYAIIDKSGNPVDGWHKFEVTE